jgi:adenylate kinase
MNIILIGPQGSGKGTQSEYLFEKYKIHHISTGDIFRENIKNGTKLGKLAESLINKGNLVPDDVTNELVKDKLKEKEYKKGFILDGYPRNLEQAGFLDKITKIDHVIDIEVSDKETMRRLTCRRQCKNCKKIYGSIHMSNIDGEKCPVCSGELYQRDDDKPNAIKKRLEIYHNETEPLKDYYRKKGVLSEIDGEQTREKVFEDILSSMNKK